MAQEQVVVQKSNTGLIIGVLAVVVVLGVVGFFILKPNTTGGSTNNSDSGKSAGSKPSTPVKSEVNNPSTTGTQYFDSVGNNVTASFEAGDYDGVVYDEDGKALSGFSGRLTNQPSKTNLS